MSVELQRIRGELMREALSKSWTKPQDVQAPWTELVDSQRLERWYRKLYTPNEQPLVGGGRLVNHFMLGADPEFVFHTAEGRVDARGLNLKAGPAFGADNNGRLVELRAHPSRHALEVLASLWLAMRWMPVYHPDTLHYAWRGGSYFENDGLGGHIHFGRKREKLREREVGALDRITHLLFVSNVFDREEGRMRVQRATGAPPGHPYGALGDVRKQPHGFEYRTLPSWIDNLWQAYFTLVLSKLVVAFPESVPVLCQADGSITAEQARNQLRLLLAYYAPLDDDARLAYAILVRNGFPTHAGGTDIKVSWGIFSDSPFGGPAKVKAPDVLPITVPPRPEDLQELADAMFIGRIPEEPGLEPTWHPNSLPAGYLHAINFVDTKVAPNLGEVAMRYCFHKSHKAAFANPGGTNWLVRFPISAMNKLYNTPDFKARFHDMFDCRGDGGVLYVNCSKDVQLDKMLEIIDAASDLNCLPVWRVNKVTADSVKLFAEYLKSDVRTDKHSKIVQRNCQIVFKDSGS